AGADGPQGAPGPAGPTGPAGDDALLTCSRSRQGRASKPSCKLRLSAPAGSAVAVELRAKGKRVARAALASASGRKQTIVLRTKKKLRPGTVTARITITAPGAAAHVVRRMAKVTR
ncbi:MAG: hypothetical protein ACJ762_04610, partial [Solirubrobacteraceae bacterium]